jgi:hypothetical protein
LELELLLELELELELELLLWFELELLLWFELELLLWFELELLLWFELELLLWFELELLLWFEPAFACADDARFRRLTARRCSMARACHHSIRFPSILRSMGVDAFALRETGATVPWPASDRDDRGSNAAPTAMPRAPSAPAYIARIFLFSNAISSSSFR